MDKTFVFFQGEAATLKPMLPAGSQMFGRMTCWRDGLPAVNPEVPFPSTSSFLIETTPPLTSRRPGESRTLKRENSEGKLIYWNCIILHSWRRETVKNTNTRVNFLLPSYVISQSSHSGAKQKSWAAPQNSQDCHLGTREQWWKIKTGRADGYPGSSGAEEVAEVGEGRD